jgi:murein endopeptidase
MTRAAIVAAVIALVAAPAAAGRRAEGEPPAAQPVIAWRHSIAVGTWWNGRLIRGVQLPAEGPDWFTWDPVLKRKPDRGWRRWGTDRLLRVLLDVLAAYRAANPGVARVGVGDISRRHGGPFGREFGGLGHGSHQIGLDVDVYYPRLDRLERRAYKPSQVDEALSQDLLDRFVAAGAKTVYVGPHLHLHGPRGVVAPLVYHDDHMHVRLPLR